MLAEGAVLACGPHRRERPGAMSGEPAPPLQGRCRWQAAPEARGKRAAVPAPTRLGPKGPRAKT
jgi:hypothetical protein